MDHASLVLELRIPIYMYTKTLRSSTDHPREVEISGLFPDSYPGKKLL